MKLKQLVLTALAVGSFCSAASAQTVIDLVGSTAARAAVHDKIIEVFGQPGNSVSSYAYNSGTLLGSNQAIFHGNINGNAVIIRSFWAGSVNGVQDIVQNIQQTGLYLKTILGSAGGAQVATSGNLAPASAETVPEIGFSDVFAATTGFAAPSTETSVAVIPFKYFKNDPASSVADSAKITNVTAQIVATGYRGGLGSIPLSAFSGLLGDIGTSVRVVGRNTDSGTRLTAMTEAGISAFVAVNQYGSGLTVSGGVVTAYGARNNNGFSSGSSLATALGGTNAIPFIAYLGPSDWALAVSGAAVELPYNGVTYSEAGVQYGQYTFWGYLHQNHNGITGTSLDVFDKISAALVANPANGLISNDVSTMLVKRPGDGGIISPR